MSQAIKPNAINIGESINRLFYNSKELFMYRPLFFYGCKSRIRQIITKKNIPNSEYVYANLKANGWKICENSCKQALLLLSKSWVDEYFFTQNDEDNNQVNIVNTQDNILSNIQDKIKIKAKLVVKKAPSILHLQDNEKFKDDQGNIYEIETRGKQTHDQILFKVSDVSRVFDVQRLNEILLQQNSGYRRNIDYDTYVISKTSDAPINYQSGSIANMTTEKCLFLTYRGLLRALFVSRNEKVNQFQDWAQKTLFTVQMGTREEKIKLGTDILNISPKTYKAVFESYASTFPSIYMLSLGKIADIKESLGITDTTINDNSIVYKFGFTNDLSRRITEHETSYSKYAGVKLKLATFHTVDVKYASEAENEIRKLCGAFNVRLEVDGRNELIVLDDKQYEQIKKSYVQIGKEYIGATQEMQKQLQELKNNVKDSENEKHLIAMQHKNELALCKNELLQKDNEINMYKMQLEHQIAMAALEKQVYMLTK